MKALEGGVFAFGAVAADEVVARCLVQFGHHGGDVGGVILEVAVKGGDQFAASVMDASVHSGALASVFCEGKDSDAGASIDSLKGGVGRTIIDKDEFVIDAD